MERESIVKFFNRDIQDSFYKLEQGDEQERERVKLINQAMNNSE